MTAHAACFGCALLVAAASGCRLSEDGSAEVRTGVAPNTAPALDSSADAARQPLTPAAIGEALRAIGPYVSHGDSVLELRANARRVMLQLRMGSTATMAEFVYDGRVLGPIPTHIAGTGELGANLFDLASVDWEALGKLFPVAKDAVDPADGRVTELVVRRHLPFTRDVRARIYVTSPRMSGHLDADANGVPLEPPQHKAP